MTDMAVGGRPKQEPMAAPRSILTRGCLELEVESDGVRYIHVHGSELARRIFVAVRDPAWGTVPGSVIDSVVTNTTGRDLEIAMKLEHVDAAQGIDFEWQGVFRASDDGSLDFEFDGIARSAFRYARIGLCCLHPVDFATGAFRALTPQGWIEGHLPDLIAPQLPGSHGFGEPLFPAFEKLELTRHDGVGVSFEFEGDLFELEDQRNWTDASFKTYSTPLALGNQHLAKAGATFHQRVRLTPSEAPAPPPRFTANAGGRSGRPEIVLGDLIDARVPPIGLCSASTGNPLHQSAVALLADLAPAHVRVDLHLEDVEMDSAFRQAAVEAEMIGAALEVAVVRSGGSDEVERLAVLLEHSMTTVERVIIFDEHATLPPITLVRAVREAIAATGNLTQVYAGTTGLFADLNAARPMLDLHGGIAYALCPTVHADDDLSLIETIPMHGETVRTARAFVGRRPISIGPITLRERSRRASPLGQRVDVPEHQIDPRQANLLGAVWTLGSAISLAADGNVSLTYFETGGDYGVVSDDGLAVFPLYHALADLCELRGAPQVAVSARESGPIVALAARGRGGCTHLVLGNADSTAAAVTVRGLPPGTTRVRRLIDESPRSPALKDPKTYRESYEMVPRVKVLDLEPFELLRVDVNP